MTPDMLITEWVRKRLDLGFDIAHRDIRELLSRLDTLEREREAKVGFARLSAQESQRANAAEARLRAAEEALTSVRYFVDTYCGKSVAREVNKRIDAALAGVQAPTLAGGGDEGGTATAREPTSRVAPAASAGEDAPQQPKPQRPDRQPEGSGWGWQPYTPDEIALGYGTDDDPRFPKPAGEDRFA